MTRHAFLQIQEETVLAPDGGRCLITHVYGADESLPPVIYLPGMFTGRGFWLSPKGIGLAAHLAKAGFPGIIVERREQGCGARPGLEEHLQHDLPLVQQRAEARWSRPAFWVGHSFGGVLAARAVAGPLDMDRVAGLVLFAAQFEVGKRALHPPLAWLTAATARLLDRFPARRLGLGPQDEPVAAMLDAIRLVTRGRRHPGLRQTLGGITVPTLGISGLGDRVDPTEGCEKLLAHFASSDKRFVAAGTKTGFSEDYDHPGIVVSKTAQQEIWPLVTDWLMARSRSNLSSSRPNGS